MMRPYEGRLFAHSQISCQRKFVAKYLGFSVKPVAKFLRL